MCGLPHSLEAGFYGDLYAENIFNDLDYYEMFDTQLYITIVNNVFNCRLCSMYIVYYVFVYFIRLTDYFH